MKNLILRFLNVIGILLMVLAILLAVPLTLPKFAGYQIYAVLSGSMEPVYPIHSVVYVKSCSASEVAVGDTITFSLLGKSKTVMTHRVIEIDPVSQTFVTKGDANTQNDSEKVAFRQLIGKAEFCIPMLALVSEFVNTKYGKTSLIIVFSAILLCWFLFDINRKKEKVRSKPEKTEQHAKSRGRMVKNSTMILQGSGFLLMLFALIGLFQIFVQYQKGADEYKELQKYVETTETETREETLQEQETDLWSKQNTAIAFDKLVVENKDIVAWLLFDNLNINYPIMYSGDNTYYLTHTFSGMENTSAALFMEASCKPDFNEYHTIIYGHNMKNGSMFGGLKKYKDQAFYQENQYFTLCTQEANYRYQIFSVQYVNVGNEVYTIGFAADENYQKFLDRMKKSSLYDTDVPVTNKDKIITLSTCTYSDEKRFVVMAKCTMVKYKKNNQNP